MLQFAHVTGRPAKKRGKTAFLLEDIHFTLKEGYLMGLTGKNGSGKTSLLKLMLEEQAVYEGKILFCGEEIREDRIGFLDQIGYVSDENRFWINKSASENAALFGPLYTNWQKEDFTACMKALQVPEKRELARLSRGEFIKFQLAFAMGHHARLYLLDEATAGMDAVFRKDFFQILRELMAKETCSILMTTQLQTDLDRNMDYIGVMEDGRLVQFQENPA